MTPDDHLSRLRRELYAFGDCLHGPLSTPIAHCGTWTLYDLADHLGRGNLWAAAAVTRHRGDHRTPAAPRDPSALRVWYATSSVILLTVLEADPSTPAWSFAPPRTVGFWRRRRCLETLVHRWDAEHASGAAGFVDPVLAEDGIAEVIDVMAPRQVELGRMQALPQSVRLTATGSGRSWTLGPGDPVAGVNAAAEDLLLMLWGRRAVDEPTLDWQGDVAVGRKLLGGPLVP